MMTIRKRHRTLHFIGIGGVGMSALAEVLAAKGYIITGSDRHPSAITKRLESLGAHIQYDHEPRLVKSADLAVYSSAISPDNPERAFAHKAGIPIMRRAEMLGELMRSMFSICIAGAHGKTTTTALTARVFQDAGRDPTVLVGGLLRESGSTAAIGASGVLIAEADEFDRSFLSMHPSLAVITNIDADHLDCYASIDAIEDAFVEFANRTPFYGAVIACVDDARVRSVLPRVHKTIITYGIDREAEYRASELVVSAEGTSFAVSNASGILGRITLSIPGRHNVLNCLAAIAAGIEMDIGFEDIARSCTAFRGVRRRFEIVGVCNGITVVDDYAHHPREIAATVAAARALGAGRVIAVFQPHLYTRTRDLADDFACELAKADAVVLTEIYRAREEPLPGITAMMLVEKMRDLGYRNVQFAASAADVPSALEGMLHAGDMVLVMGAGDIGKAAQQVWERIHA